MIEEQFRTWAVVEVMGHQEYAGFVCSEQVAGVHMLRIDVPECMTVPAFTKYQSPSSIYGITPCTEQTARARANELRREPVSSWGIEKKVVAELRREGLLIENQKSAEDALTDVPF